MSTSSQISTTKAPPSKNTRMTISTMPNKSPEPTAGGAVSNPRRFALSIDFSRRWLSFLR